MSSAKLIRALFDNITENEARKALEIIEEPALSYVAQYAGESTMKVEANINKKIERRKKKYPNSNWYSAVGKKR